MKRFFIFFFPVLILISSIFFGFAIFQVRNEKLKLIDETKRKAKAVAETMEWAASYFLKSKDLTNAYNLVDKFQKRERIQGCALYDSSGKIIAINQKFAEWVDKEKPYISEILVSKNPRGGIEKYNGKKVFSYVLPVTDSSDNFLGLVEVLYDLSYLNIGLNEFWKRIYITLFILLFSTIGLISLLHKHFFINPVKRLTHWFNEFQKSDIEAIYPLKEDAEFASLASEIEQVALKIKVAKKNISENASKRIEIAEIWDEQRLKEFIRAKLGTNELLMVSNREPYMHIFENETSKIKCIRPASGVVTAIDSVMLACGGIWVGHGAGNADKKMVNSKNKVGVPPGENKYILKRIWLTKEEESGYYYGFSNEGLWPLCHITYTRPIFRNSDWKMYQEVNKKFAESILEELPNENPLVFIQDYHFTLLPKMLKEKRPDAKIVLFWHIPWPNQEVFSICPYKNEILEGMLGCDLIGFHVQYHCNNFLDTVNRFVECRIDTEKFSVIKGNIETLIKPFPISIDDNYANEKNLENETKQIKEELNLKNLIIGIGVERIDYTKGILERFLAIDRFLEKFPEYIGKFVFIQIAAPSRTHIKRYHDLGSEIEELVDKKNWKYSTGDWKPIIYIKRHFAPEEILPYYQMGDFCIVSSLHDGMNLVAKEYIANKTDENGVLILSRFTGASKELSDAVFINPYDIENFADRIKFAIEMETEEKKRRMKNMRNIVKHNNIYNWAANIINELTSLKKPSNA